MRLSARRLTELREDIARQSQFKLLKLKIPKLTLSEIKKERQYWIFVSVKMKEMKGGDGRQRQMEDCSFREATRRSGGLLGSQQSATRLHVHDKSSFPQSKSFEFKNTVSVVIQPWNNWNM